MLKKSHLLSPYIDKIVSLFSGPMQLEIIESMNGLDWSLDKSYLAQEKILMVVYQHIKEGTVTSLVDIQASFLD